MKSTKFKIKSSITSLSSGINHTIFTTSDGKLYFIGSNEKYQSGQNAIPVMPQTPQEISFKKSDYFIMASAGDYFSAFIIKNKITGKKY